MLRKIWMPFVSFVYLGVHDSHFSRKKKIIKKIIEELNSRLLFANWVRSNLTTWLMTTANEYNLLIAQACNSTILCLIFERWQWIKKFKGYSVLSANQPTLKIFSTILKSSFYYTLNLMGRYLNVKHRFSSLVRVV